MSKPIFSRKAILEVLDYDPKTGHFTWLVSRGKAKAGERAGYVGQGGAPTRRISYRRIQVLKHSLHEQQLAWFLMTGKWVDYIDHINDDTLDNRWSNLRAGTFAQRNGRRNLTRNNTSGLKGVMYVTRRKVWQARLGRKYLGSFDCPAAAHFAYIVAAHEAYGDFANNGRERSASNSVLR